MDDWKQEWIRYARGLVGDATHCRACEQVLGLDATARMDAADLRWPGYVGATYRPGGLLMAATVHREFASGKPPLPAADRDRLVGATRSWRDGTLGDEQWLEQVREVYTTGFARHWPVGRLSRALGRRIGLSLGDLAYVNAARCQVAENPPPRGAGAVKRGVVALCSRDYPLAGLVAVLRPAALLVVKGTHDAASAALQATGVPVVVVDQRQLGLRAPFPGRALALPYGTGVDAWAPALRDLLANRPAASAAPRVTTAARSGPRGSAADRPVAKASVAPGTGHRPIRPAGGGPAPTRPKRTGCRPVHLHSSVTAPANGRRKRERERERERMTQVQGRPGVVSRQQQP